MYLTPFHSFCHTSYWNYWHETEISMQEALHVLPCKRLFYVWPLSVCFEILLTTIRMLFCIVFCVVRNSTSTICMSEPIQMGSLRLVLLPKTERTREIRNGSLSQILPHRMRLATDSLGKGCTICFRKFHSSFCSFHRNIVSGQRCNPIEPREKVYLSIQELKINCSMIDCRIILPTVCGLNPNLRNRDEHGSHFPWIKMQFIQFVSISFDLLHFRNYNT